MICKYRMSIQQNRPPRGGWCVAAQTTAADARSRKCLRRPNKRSPPSGAADPCHEIRMQTLVVSLGLFERRFLACPAGGPQLYQQRLRQSLQERTLWRAWVAVGDCGGRGVARAWSDVVERSWPDGPSGRRHAIFFPSDDSSQPPWLWAAPLCGLSPRAAARFLFQISRVSATKRNTRPTSHGQPASHPATTTDASPLSRVRADDRTEVRAQ